MSATATIQLDTRTAQQLVGCTVSFAPGTIFSSNGANSRADGTWNDEPPITSFVPADVTDAGENADDGFWLEIQPQGSTGGVLYVFSNVNRGSVFIDPAQIFDSETLENYELIDMAPASVIEQAKATIKKFPWKLAAITFLIGAAIVYLATRKQ